MIKFYSARAVLVWFYELKTSVKNNIKASIEKHGAETKRNSKERRIRLDS